MGCYLHKSFNSCCKNSRNYCWDNMPHVPLYQTIVCGIRGGLIQGMTETERVQKWGYTWRKLDLGFEPREEIISRGLDFIGEIKNCILIMSILVVNACAFYWPFNKRTRSLQGFNRRPRKHIDHHYLNCRKIEISASR